MPRMAPTRMAVSNGRKPARRSAEGDARLWERRSGGGRRRELDAATVSRGRGAKSGRGGSSTPLPATARTTRTR